MRAPLSGLLLRSKSVSQILEVLAEVYVGQMRCAFVLTS